MPQLSKKNIGAWLFTLMCTVLAVSPVSAQTGYQIRPGDTLRIEVLEDSALNRDVLVLPDGTISFPLAGTVRARGRTVSDLQGTLAAELASNFAAQPNVFVSVSTIAERRAVRGRAAAAPVVAAYVMGEIAKPGKLEVTPGTTILQVLAEAGGLTRFAADKRIELRRSNPETGEVKIYLFSYSGQGKGQRIAGSTVLQPGDVIVVPERRLFE